MQMTFFSPKSSAVYLSLKNGHHLVDATMKTCGGFGFSIKKVLTTMVEEHGPLNCRIDASRQKIYLIQ